MEIITRNEKILYIVIDVHKDTYSLCCFVFHKNELSDEMTIKATTKAVIVTTAVETVVEIHDFTRFATAAQFVSYLGLCPVEDSSGKIKNMLPLTKAGNKVSS